MPAEWEPHRGTWLSWPHKEASWPGKFGAGARHLRGAGARTSPTTRRSTSTSPARRWRRGAGTCSRTRGADLGSVFFHRIPTNDAWCRDHGPIFVAAAAGRPPRAGHRRLGLQRVGRQVPAVRPRRRRSPRASARSSGSPCSSPASCWRAARSTSTARGTLLTTEACLLNPNRNPELDRAADRGSIFAIYLGVTKILWLGDGIVGDDTDGHVDDLTRFVDERTVVTVVEDDPADENYEPLQENLERLRRDDRPGRPARSGSSRCRCRGALVHDGQRLPASYANFYIANGVVLRADLRSARATRRRWPRCSGSFPSRDVVGIDCTDLVWGLGAFHCVTQQWPA